MKEKMKNMSYRVAAPVVGVGTALLIPVKAFAADTATSSIDVLTDTMIQSFTGIGTSVMAMIGKILPIALPIIGSVIVITFGLKIFKKVTGKA